MDAVANPFSPGAGNQPPELAGREEILSAVDVTLRRLQAGAFSKSSIFVGLRGVGKTVLLNRAREMAEALGMLTVSIEAHEDKPLPDLLLPPLRKTLLKLNFGDFTEVTRRGLRVFKSFVNRQAGVKATSTGPLRSSLIRKGMIYSPSHGDNAFTVPLFDGFLRRQRGESAP